jgi:spore coat protein U-like protein
MVDFGTIDPTSTQPVDTTLTANIVCTGGPANGAIQVCPALGSQYSTDDGSARRMKLPTDPASSVTTNLFTDPARTEVWAHPEWTGTGGVPSSTIQLDGNGNGRATFTIYARAWPATHIGPSGNYQNNIPANQQHIYYEMPPVQGECTFNNRWPDSGNTISMFATVIPACTVTGTQTVDFGEGASTGRLDARGSISVRCTQDTEFTVALNGGGEGDILNRKMRMGNETIAYQLYTDTSRTTIFGDGTQGVAPPGIGLNATDVNFPVYGRVDLQALPKPGTYTDTVIVTVSY